MFDSHDVIDGCVFKKSKLNTVVATLESSAIGTTDTSNRQSAYMPCKMGAIPDLTP